MARLYITEYQRMVADGRTLVPAGEEPCIVTQTVTIGGASTQSQVFNERTKFVRLHCDAICSIKFGASPTATADDARLAANQTEFFGVTQGHRLAVITNT